MTGFTNKKSNFRLKLALFDLSLETLQIMQGVALFKILPYLTQFLKNLSLPYLK